MGSGKGTPQMLITIANFAYPIEANLAKSRLESEGIGLYSDQ